MLPLSPLLVLSPTRQHQQRPAPSPGSRFDVAPSIADQIRTGRIDSELEFRRLDHAASRLARRMILLRQRGAVEKPANPDAPFGQVRFDLLGLTLEFKWR